MLEKGLKGHMQCGSMFRRVVGTNHRTTVQFSFSNIYSKLDFSHNGTFDRSFFTPGHVFGFQP